MSGVTNKKRKLNTRSTSLSQLYNEIQNLSAEEKRNAMKEEKYRQASFGSNWPHYASKTLNAAKMAQAHLYYTGLGDKATCPYCKVFIELWNENDDPMEQHKEYAKGCCDYFNNQAAGSGSNKSKDVQKDRRLDSAKHGIRDNRDPRMTIPRNRLGSFVDNWHRGNAKLEQELSNAGFYRDENDRNREDGDKVVCFSCGLTLCKWHNNDDPWIEHAREMPNCDFVLKEKGAFFIDQVTNGPESREHIRVCSGIARQQGISQTDIDEALSRGPYESEQAMENAILNAGHENMAARGAQAADDGDELDRGIINKTPPIEKDNVLDLS